jgi:hypothetical protein
MKKAALLVVVIAGGVFAGCMSQAPAAPAAPAAPGVAGELSARPGAAAPGTYELSFLGGGQPVESLVIGQRVILKARVVNASTGLPASSGTVTFQYCSRPGPKNDISRADEAPKAECETGSARWATLVSIGVNVNGEAFGGLGPVQIPRTIGFRFLFRADKSGIASGGSPHIDFTWTAQ